VPLGFWGAMSAVLGLAVLAGFSRTFYLRAVFDVPRVPSYVLVHGGVLTAWFAGLLVQALLVSSQRTRIHRRLGWLVVAVGLSVVAITGPTILNLAPRQSAQGIDIDARVVRLVWLDLAILAAFAVFLAAGILMRHRAAWHKRLMLLASISIVTPAVGRAWRLIPVLRELDPNLLTSYALMVLLLGLASHDVFLRKRVHPATLAGGALLIGLRTVAAFIANSELGWSFVRGLG
jgi:uncharacterized membrane protein YozB (DUF420 family)